MKLTVHIVHYAKRCHYETPGHCVRCSPPPYLSRRNRFETSRLWAILHIASPILSFLTQNLADCQSNQHLPVKRRRCPGYCVVEKVHMASEDLGVHELMLVNGGDEQRHIRGKNVVEGAKHEVHFYWSPLAPHPSRSSPPQPPPGTLTLMNSQAPQAQTNIVCPQCTGIQTILVFKPKPQTHSTSKRDPDVCCVDKSTRPLENSETSVHKNSPIIPYNKCKSLSFAWHTNTSQTCDLRQNGVPPIEVQTHTSCAGSLYR